MKVTASNAWAGSRNATMLFDFNLNKLVVMIVPLLFAITIHEVAHGWVANRLGDPTAKWSGRLSLNPIKHLDVVGSFVLPLMLLLARSPIIFGYAKPVPVNFANLRNLRRDTILVASAGVVTNLLFALLSGAVFRILFYLGSFWSESILSFVVWDLFYMLGYSVLINLILAVFNMIPVPPLDGSKILLMVLPPRYAAHFASIERFGMIILIFLLFTGMLNGIMSFFVQPMLQISLGNQGLLVFLHYIMS
jgi:Zn-dependent protease